MSISLTRAASLRASWVGAEKRRAALVERNRGPYSEATRLKMSMTAKRRWATPEGSAELKRRQSAGGIKVQATGRPAQFLRDLAPELRNTPQQREAARRIGLANRGRPGPNLGRQFSDTARANMRRGAQRRAATEEGQQNIAKAIRASRMSRGPTCLERALYERLAEQGLAFEPEKQIGSYHIDAYVPSTRTAYEADGPHHLREAIWQRDRVRDAYLLRNSLVDRVIRLTSAELL